MRGHCRSDLIAAAAPPVIEPVDEHRRAHRPAPEQQRQDPGAAHAVVLPARPPANRTGIDRLDMEDEGVALAAAAAAQRGRSDAAAPAP